MLLVDFEKSCHPRSQCLIASADLVEVLGLSISIGLLSGEVEMVANHALEDYEVEKGYVLSCQSYPVTDNLVVDYDQ